MAASQAVRFFGLFQFVSGLFFGQKGLIGVDARRQDQVRKK
jgi:hypothetical protein